MPRVITSPEARADLDSIADHIAADSRRAAEHFVGVILRKFQLYAGQPDMGRKRPELGPDIRSSPHASYVIFYTPIPDGIRVERVLHGARDIETEFPT